MATRAPKEKRRNSEKRKEKSRDAARCRRSKESEIFSDMAQLLPVPGSLSSQLDKASIMRLTIAFLKARSLLGNKGRESFWMEEKCSDNDNSWPQALGGILLALSSEGDIVYLTENVTQQLGLPQVDLIGQSIYDYSHPCDHDELRDMLSLRADGQLTRSFFLRLKSTLTVKGRSNNLKAASYKVMNCCGRIVPGEAIQEDFDDEEEVKATGHFLVLIADPIPHPSNIEMPLDGYTFLTKHSLDMKYTYVDDKVFDFLGYATDELEGQSAYELHHALDNDIIMKSYKTMFAKGQVETPPYRFLARYGGYAWVQTQATLVYGAQDSRPQAVVCVHTCMSEIEEKDQILCANQAEIYDRVPERPVMVAPVTMRKLVSEKAPQKMTSKLFVPKTAEMNKGFLIFDKVKGASVLKEEPDDLTHLAPTAGDACIPLDMPSIAFPGDFFDELAPELLDCLPMTGFEFSPLGPSEEMTACDDDEMSAAPAVVPCAVKEDPFIFFNVESAPEIRDSSPQSKSDYEEDVSPSSSEQTDVGQSEDEEELSRRAPYIPMSESDDLPLFDPSELFLGLDLDCLPVNPLFKTESIFAAADQSVLVKLPQNSSAKPDLLNYQRPASYQALKRSCPVDDSNPKRVKVPNVPAVSRGATSSLMELLTEKPLDRQSPSVLQNLLVSGHDFQTGHELQRERPYSAVSPTLRLSSPPPSSDWLKGESVHRTMQRHGSPCDLGSDGESTSLSEGFSTFPFDMDVVAAPLELDAGDFFSCSLPVEFAAD